MLLQSYISKGALISWKTRITLILGRRGRSQPGDTIHSQNQLEPSRSYPCPVGPNGTSRNQCGTDWANSQHRMCPVQYRITVRIYSEMFLFRVAVVFCCIIMFIIFLLWHLAAEQLRLQRLYYYVIFYYGKSEYFLLLYCTLCLTVYLISFRRLNVMAPAAPVKRWRQPSG